MIIPTPQDISLRETLGADDTYNRYFFFVGLKPFQTIAELWDVGQGGRTVVLRETDVARMSRPDCKV